MLENFIQANHSRVTEWIADYKNRYKPFFYNSCDVRFSGFKVTQVDANCFPAGFNNLSPEGYANAVGLYKSYFEEKRIKNILIFPEFHTRNFGYLKNVRTLRGIFEEAGCAVKIATNLDYEFNIDLTQSEIPSVLEAVREGMSAEENSLTFDPISKCKWFFQRKHKLGAGDKKSCFVADLVVLNNDLTLGLPEIFKKTNSLILPTSKLGWFNRLKSDHFTKYSEVVQDFGREFKIDPWFFDGIFDSASGLDFKTGQGMAELEQKVTEVFAKVEGKYKEHGIAQKPSIFIKSNKGTYGMGIHVVSSAEEVREFNKNIRKKMAVVKDGAETHSVIIQEGVPTIFEQSGRAVEPVVYSCLSRPVGMFFRSNIGSMANLNTKGMGLTSSFELSQNAAYLCLLVAEMANIAIMKEAEEANL